MSLAIIVKGQTFLKAMAPLIVFSGECIDDGEVIVAAYRSRPGKSYDNTQFDVLDEIIKTAKNSENIRVLSVENDDDLVKKLKDESIKNVICQDAQNHYHFLHDHFRVFSIAIFTDTLHHAAKNGRFKNPCPRQYRTYFASEYLHKTAERLSDASWPGAALGSPMFDHVLWLGNNNSQAGSVSFLTPPEQLLSVSQKNEIRDLADYVVNEKSASFFLKDRERFQYSCASDVMTRVSNQELAFPYTSLAMLAKTDIHMTAYSTSVFEADFLGIPVINLEILDFPSIGNHMVKTYSLDEIFHSDMCVTCKSNLIETYDSLIQKRAKIKRDITFNDNHSIDILLDIKKQLL